MRLTWPSAWGGGRSGRSSSPCSLSASRQCVRNCEDSDPSGNTITGAGQSERTNQERGSSCEHKNQGYRKSARLTCQLLAHEHSPEQTPVVIKLRAFLHPSNAALEHSRSRRQEWKGQVRYLILHNLALISRFPIAWNSMPKTFNEDVICLSFLLSHLLIFIKDRISPKKCLPCSEKMYRYVSLRIESWAFVC